MQKIHPNTTEEASLWKEKDYGIDIQAMIKRLEVLEQNTVRVAEKVSEKGTEKPFSLDDALADTVQLPFGSIYGLACLGPAQSEPEELVRELIVTMYVLKCAHISSSPSSPSSEMLRTTW